MAALVTKIYDYLLAHRMLRRCSFVLVTIVLVVFFSGQHYKEDITDFLPLGETHQKAMAVYQDISGADRLFVLFQSKDSSEVDPDSLSAAMEDYRGILSSLDPVGEAAGLSAQVDYDQLDELSDFVYRHIPYFLTESDYARMDSLLSDEGYIVRQLQADKQLLMFPVSGLFSDNMQRDPLNLFTPAVSRLQQSGAEMSYELHDGDIFSRDMRCSLLMLTSPYGSSETDHNARLVSLLEQAAAQTAQVHSGLSVHIAGGPSVAVGNARQIRHDSVVSIILAVLLIVGLLYYAFRSVWNISLMVLSIGWGWLFAMGLLAVVHDNVSVIVIGISSIILGIAFNYPLHLIAHMQHAPSVRTALKEIVAPLVVGNITTVGAFLALVPLSSQALRDLGLFSSFLLIGTILFVLFYLPHAAQSHPGHTPPAAIRRVSSLRLENKRWLVVLVVVLTCVFGYFSLGTTFDANMNHINYMTAEQRADMDYLQEHFVSTSKQKTLYVVYEGETLDEALDRCQAGHEKSDALLSRGEVSSVRSCVPFFISSSGQARRLERWSRFTATHRTLFDSHLPAAARQAGFAEGSFDEFLSILHATYIPREATYFDSVRDLLFANHVRTDSVHHCYSVVDQLLADEERFDALKQHFAVEGDGMYAFDIESMNGTIASTLSDNFNYIGWACGLIVFFFLWFSLGSIELAVLSFLPMAVSWVWIMGIMTLLGIHFNMVNVILATFIFGQGDDYTIFITEGCQYEYAYRKKMVASYKNSIIISALIMFFGIGTLIFAKHPALHSLAEVTIIGMFTVVFMAYLLPPLLFRWLVMKDGAYRRRPLTLRRLFRRGGDDDMVSVVTDRYRYKGHDIVSAVKRSLRDHGDEVLGRWKDCRDERIMVDASGYGELALLLALHHPDKTIVACEEDEEKQLVARYSAEGLVRNVVFEGEACR